ncbi:MAG: site-specific integrase, partial [Pedococcus sp.]
MPPRARKASRRGFGKLRRLPSGRYQASYIGPDLARHPAPDTFETKMDGEAWLAGERRLLAEDDWLPPGLRRHNRALTFEAYSDRWLDARELKPSTTALYRGILDRTLVPAFGDRLITRISAADVRAWYATLDPARKTTRAHAYSLLRVLCATAVVEEHIGANPCTIRGAGQAKRARRIDPATLDELAALVAAMPERLRLMPLFASWCGLRFGEVIELRRRDLDLDRGLLSVTRGVVRVMGADIVGKPKSMAGVRIVAIPPHLLPVVAAHLTEHVRLGRDALLFPHD